MKVIDVSIFGSEMKKLCDEASRGELIVLTNGEARFHLLPSFPDAVETSENLERELLKGLESPLTPYLPEESRTALDKALRERKRR